VGFPRNFRLNLNITAQLYLGLVKAARLEHITNNEVVERALWKYLSRITLSGDILERLRQAHALIYEVIVTASKIPLQVAKGPANIHEKAPRQQRRNELSEKTHSALDAVSDLAESEKLAEEAQARATMYAIIASLATVDALILRDASQEEILAEIAELREEDAKFEEATRELEEKAKEKA
jgi:hypothetical protein